MDGDDIIFYEDDVVIMSSVQTAVVEVEWEVSRIDEKKVENNSKYE